MLISQEPVPVIVTMYFSVVLNKELYYIIHLLHLVLAHIHQGSWFTKNMFLLVRNSEIFNHQFSSVQNSLLEKKHQYKYIMRSLHINL